MAAPLAAAVAVGTLVAPLVSPEWKAPGQPWFLGQAKNVEQAMVAAGFLAAAAVPWLMRSTWGRAGVGLVAALGTFILTAKGSAFLLSNAPGVILASTLAASVSAAWRRGEGTASQPCSAGAGGGLRMAIWTFAASALACLTGIFSVVALPIDVFHDGEVLSSALDFLGGGRPFETFLWPHGLHDTGLAAFWILVTGKVGTSPVVLAYATCCALGVLTASVLAKALNCTAHESLAAAAAVSLPFLTGIGPGVMDLLSPFRLGVMFFVVVGFAVLVSPWRHREGVAGLCFGLAYLFRVEAGLFGVVASAAVIAWRSLGNASATVGERGRRFVWSLLQFFAGMALCLGACRAAFGWPGRAWFEYTLDILPSYHRDATGLFVPWFGDASRPVDSPEALLLAWLVFVAVLVAQAAAHLDAGPGVNARAEKLLFLSVFAVLATRSAVDRSDSEHIRQWVSLPLLGVLLMTVTAVRESWRLGAGRSAAACFALVGLLSMFGGFFPPPLWQSPSSEVARTPRWALFLEHL